jgi:hypothetical protein
MTVESFVKAITDVKTPFMLAAFAIAAVLAVFAAVAKNKSSVQKALWLTVGAITIVALVPIALDAIAQSRNGQTIYRVRVLTLDDRDVPVSGATVRVDASNEARTSADGSCELLIPKGVLQVSGRITIYAERGNQHGKMDVTLATDPNPSISIHVLRDRSAGLVGIVEGRDKHVLSGVHVTVLGGTPVETDASGMFRVAPFAAPGERVRLHFEKPGFKGSDIYQTIDDTPLTVIMDPDGLQKH